MKKPSKAKRKSAGSARQARAPSAALRAGASGTSARKAAPASTASPPERAAAVASIAFPREDRQSLALLLAPVVVMTLALGAMQSLAPTDAARRQLALLPAPVGVSATAPSSALSVAAPSSAVSAPDGGIVRTVGVLAERPAPIAAIAPAMLKTTAVYERARTLSAVSELHELPASEPILAKLASLGHPDRCEVMQSGVGTTTVAAPSPEAFGRMLAAAARRETEDLVVYTDKYRDMGFPMGDVRPLYGVCTDVVVRAYRALGVDLQVLVHNAKLGTGDPSIDHRRVETLRRFFAKYGTSIPVTDFVEEFQPGDIVTYRRPEGRGSQTHIAIVSDVIAPSGRPMVVHNRGWGPQLEDALFANGMTGHYRFANTASAVQAVTPPQTPVPAHHAAQTPWPEAERLKVSAAAAR